MDYYNGGMSTLDDCKHEPVKPVPAPEGTIDDKPPYSYVAMIYMAIKGYTFWKNYYTD